MSKLKDFYSDYYSAIDEEKDRIDEVHEGLREGGWQSAFENLKKVMRDYGYQLVTGEKPKELINEDLFEKVGTKGFRSDALINALIEMDNEYRALTTGVDISSPTIPAKLEQEMKEYVPRSEEELLKEAESELLPALTKKKDREIASLAKAKADYEENVTEAERAEREEIESLYSKGQTALLGHRDDMIFKGLVHSTINEKGVENLMTDLEASHLKIDEKYDRKLTKIKNELTLAEREYNNAMVEYDLEYAADLQEKLNKLKLQEEKRLEEINEYNRKLAEAQEKYKTERLNILAKLRAERQEALFEEMKREQELEAENGVSPEKRAEYAKRKDMAISFYSNFTPEEAMVLMASSNEELKNLLGKDEYYSLLKWNSSR